MCVLGDCCTISFIPPNVYRKHTLQRTISKEWRIVSITDLGRDWLTLDGGDYHLPTRLFVLEKSEGPDLRVRLPDKVTPHRILILSRAENARLTLVRWMLISAAIPLSASASLAPESGRYLHSNLFLNMLDIVRPKDMHMEAPPRVRQSAHWLRYCGRYMCRPPTVGTSSEVGSSGTVSFIRTDTGIS